MSGKPLDCLGIDPSRSEVGKHAFVPSGQPIVHGPGNPHGAEVVLKRRTPESKEQYYSEKIAELVLSQRELNRVTRERDALAAVLRQLVAAKDEKDSNGESARYREMKSGLWERARETLAKYASGELRKPGAADE